MTAPLTLSMLEEAYRDLSTRPVQPTYDFGWHCGRCKASGFSVFPLDACPMCGNQADPASSILGHQRATGSNLAREKARQIKRKSMG